MDNLNKKILNKSTSHRQSKVTVQQINQSHSIHDRYEPRQMRGAQITTKDVAEAPLHAMQILRHQLLCGRRLRHILPTEQRRSADLTRKILRRSSRISSSINSIVQIHKG